MNKLVIPSILAATVLIAGFFAFMPVNKASTVHTTVQQATDKLVSVHINVGNGTAAGFGETLPVTALENDAITGNAWILAFFETGEGNDEGCTVRAETGGEAGDADGDITVINVGSGNAGGVQIAGGAFTTVDRIIIAANYTQPAGNIDTSSSFCTFTFDFDQKGT